ncbi:MAG: hypothetical protein RR951_01055, partial [Ruthenibacterium sp.]
LCIVCDRHIALPREIAPRGGWIAALQAGKRIKISKSCAIPCVLARNSGKEAGFEDSFIFLKLP